MVRCGNGLHVLQVLAHQGVQGCQVCRRRLQPASSGSEPLEQCAKADTRRPRQVEAVAEYVLEGVGLERGGEGGLEDGGAAAFDVGFQLGEDGGVGGVVEAAVGDDDGGGRVVPQEGDGGVGLCTAHHAGVVCERGHEPLVGVLERPRLAHER